MRRSNNYEEIDDVETLEISDQAILEPIPERAEEVGGNTWQVSVGFWLVGLLNNTQYVIMIAGAKDMASGGVALVYLCSVLPALVVKLTAPYWFAHVSYAARGATVAALMAACFLTVACGSALRSTALQLVGVLLQATGGSIGEASTLALCSFFHTRQAITMWSSGTGCAGVFGYAWVVLLHSRSIGLGLSFQTTILLANGLAVVYICAFRYLCSLQACSRGPGGVLPGEGGPVELCMEDPAGQPTDTWMGDAGADGVGNGVVDGHAHGGGSAEGEAAGDGPGDGEARRDDLSSSTVAEDSNHGRTPKPSQLPEDTASSKGAEQEGEGLLAAAAAAAGAKGARRAVPGPSKRYSGWRLVRAEELTVARRCRFVAALWPYMVPLAVVYFSEYAMQSGAWATFGFPNLHRDEDRSTFYSLANWMYQLGVFISRSSGTVVRLNRLWLWLLPAIQFLLLVFFVLDSVHHFWYDWGLLAPCFVTGLIGGGVYVGAFTLIGEEVPHQLREVALSAASVGDTFGIVLSDCVGLYIQACLYRYHHISGASATCMF